ncbi:hypothetical protein [Streptomyces viridosporus]|uniref:hypothetical protein n=1 Tax=Streptomyces viridosporus TaxID=67581 RepID=UPI0001AEF506|nr:hypothetical protein [Streptomyces viridosporus]
MKISPIYCPDPSCRWSAHGIPDEFVEARDWHLAAHRADVHGVQPTPEQVAYATRAGHVIPGTAKTTDDAVAVLGALPVPGGDQPPLDEQRLAEIDARAAHLYEYVPLPPEADQLAGEDVPALLAEIQHLRHQQSLDDAEYEQATAELATAKARITELEKAAVEARVALGSLCYDLEDPGTAALGALHLLTQATVWTETGPDFAADALAQHDAKVLHETAQAMEVAGHDDDAVNLLYLLADGATPKAAANQTNPAPKEAS